MILLPTQSRANAEIFIVYSYFSFSIDYPHGLWNLCFEKL